MASCKFYVMLMIERVHIDISGRLSSQNAFQFNIRYIHRQLRLYLIYI